MIVRVSTGSLLFVLVILPPNGSLAAPFDGSTDSATKRPTDISTPNQTNSEASATLLSSFNKTGNVLKDGGFARTGEERTDPNDKVDSNRRTEDKDSKKSSTKNSSTRGSDMRSAASSTREVDTDAAVSVASSVSVLKALETSYTESTKVAVRDPNVTSQGLPTGYSSLKSDRPSTSLKKTGTDWTTSSSVDIESSRKRVIQNEDTSSTSKAAGMVEYANTMTDPAGNGKVKGTGPRDHTLSFTAARAVDPTATVDFKTETELDRAFGTAAGDHVTQMDDVRNWRRDVNATQWEVTKAEFVYKSLWDDGGTEYAVGKKETVNEGIKREGVAGGTSEQTGTGKKMRGNRGQDDRFTIPVELRKARNRNEHFSLSFHGLPWREELNILIPVLCGMFGAMILVFAAYFLRNCPNNIRRMARRRRPSERHRRKSDLNLLIDNSSGDERP